MGLLLSVLGALSVIMMIFPLALLVFYAIECLVKTVGVRANRVARLSSVPIDVTDKVVAAGVPELRPHCTIKFYERYNHETFGKTESCLVAFDENGKFLDYCRVYYGSDPEQSFKNAAQRLYKNIGPKISIRMNKQEFIDYIKDNPVILSEKTEWVED